MEAVEQDKYTRFLDEIGAEATAPSPSKPIPSVMVGHVKPLTWYRRPWVQIAVLLGVVAPVFMAIQGIIAPDDSAANEAKRSREAEQNKDLLEQMQLLEQEKNAIAIENARLTQQGIQFSEPTKPEKKETKTPVPPKPKMVRRGPVARATTPRRAVVPRIPPSRVPQVRPAPAPRPPAVAVPAKPTSPTPQIEEVESEWSNPEDVGNYFAPPSEEIDIQVVSLNDEQSGQSTDDSGPQVAAVSNDQQPTETTSVSNPPETESYIAFQNPQPIEADINADLDPDASDNIAKSSTGEPSDVEASPVAEATPVEVATSVPANTIVAGKMRDPITWVDESPPRESQTYTIYLTESVQAESGEELLPKRTELTAMVVDASPRSLTLKASDITIDGQSYPLAEGMVEITGKRGRNLIPKRKTEGGKPGFFERLGGTVVTSVLKGGGDYVRGVTSDANGLIGGGNNNLIDQVSGTALNEVGELVRPRRDSFQPTQHYYELPRKSQVEIRINQPLEVPNVS